MAITRSQTTGKFRVSAGASATGTFGAAPSVGDLVIVGFWGYAGPLWGPIDCTDNQGTRYALIARSVTNGNVTAAAWLGVVKASSGSFQVTVAAAPNQSSVLYGAGCATSWTTDAAWAIFDEVARNTGSSTAPSTGSTATLATADELVVAVLAAGGTDQASITVESVSPAWTEEAEELSYATYIPGEMDSRIVNATTAQSCSWTLASSASWSCVVVTVRETAGGGGGGGGSYVFFG